MKALLVCGTSANQLLREIINSKIGLVGILTSLETSGDLVSPQIKTLARQGVPVWSWERVRNPEFAQTVHDLNVDIILNFRSTQIMDAAVIEAPKIGSFNFHSGLLPRYAGRNVVSWSIYRGEEYHGVTVHHMAAKVDAGPIAYQESFPIHEDSALTVMRKSVSLGVNLVMKLLKTAARDPGEIPRLEQDLSQREYFSAKAVPNGGWMDWTQTARQAVNFVRACDFFPFESPWGHPRARLGAREIQIAKASRANVASKNEPGAIVDMSREGAFVACGDELVRVERIITDGRLEEPAKCFKAGARLEGEKIKLN